MGAPPEKTLYELLHDRLRRLCERDRLIALRRFGFEGPPVTLAELGHDLHVSRERVRQVEVQARSTLTLDPSLFLAIERRLKALLSRSRSPIYLDLLSVDDPWFGG